MTNKQNCPTFNVCISVKQIDADPKPAWIGSIIIWFFIPAEIEWAYCVNTVLISAFLWAVSMDVLSVVRDNG